MTPRQIERAARLWAEGRSIADISREVGAPRNTLVSAMRGHRDVFPRRRHHADEWREMLDQVEGMSARDAAMALGVSDDTIRNWRERLDRP